VGAGSVDEWLAATGESYRRVPFLAVWTKERRRRKEKGKRWASLPFSSFLFPYHTNCRHSLHFGFAKAAENFRKVFTSKLFLP
jgi:hypothetical protein